MKVICNTTVISNFAAVDALGILQARKQATAAYFQISVDAPAGAQSAMKMA